MFNNNVQYITFVLTETLTRGGPCQGCARTGRQDLNFCFWNPSCDTLSRRDENGVYGIDFHNALPPFARGRWVRKTGLRVISSVSWCKEVSWQRIWSCSAIWFSVEGCCLQMCQPWSAHQARQVNKPPITSHWLTRVMHHWRDSNHVLSFPPLVITCQVIYRQQRFSISL